MDLNRLMAPAILDYLEPWQSRAQYQPKPTYGPEWSYPLWAAQNGEVRNAPDRPRDWSAPIAEAISPTMGAYGLGQGLGNALMHGRAGDYKSAAGELGLLAAGMVAPGPKAPGKGIRAYHGSPHDFDKFDMSKIGTGEGAQAFGHGLYFAENPSVAESYKKPPGGASGADVYAQTALDEKGGDRNAALEMLRNDLLYAANATERRRVENAIVAIETNRVGPGRMYEVRINADPEHFLDLDKPLSQQSEKARAALAAEGFPRPPPPPRDLSADSAMLQAMRAAASSQLQGLRRVYAPAPDPVIGRDFDLNSAMRRPEVVGRMRDAGIPGIRYLDQGSRDAGEGSRNYVLFRDDIIDIVKKYGIAAAASMYGMDAVMQATGQPQDSNALMGQK